MNKRSKQILTAGIMLLLLVDTGTIRTGAEEGLSVCLKSVIPSLFPFLIASAVFNQSMLGAELKFLKPISSVCRVPGNCIRYLLLGFLGGYPIGAKCINDGYKAGIISRNNAHRLLGFCSNAGPSFIFGIIGCQLNVKIAVWALWGIHILSAVIVGMLIPDTNECFHNNGSNESVPGDLMQQSIKTMAIICTWVIIFRIALLYIDNILPSNTPHSVVTILSGLVELTNGCIALQSLEIQGMRFVLSSVFIAFGGVCVTMQTVSVTRDVGTGMYFYGKCMQTLISFTLAYFLQYVIWDQNACWKLHWSYVILSPVILMVILFLIKRKKF